MKAKDIALIIEEFAPLGTQEPWDNSGFCIGSPEQEIKGVMIGFDPTPELIEAAVAKGADMVITHHPLIFSGIKKINPDTFIGKAITLAIKHGMVIYSAHTNADKAEGGVTALMAKRLGLQDITPLDETLLALVGTLPSPVEPQALSAFVKKAFGIERLRSSRLIGEPVSRVSVCAGSGSSFIPQAIEADAQLFITGDVSYHHFFCPEGFMVMDIGHYESERDIVDKLYEILSKKIPTFAIHTFLNNNNNPIFYF
ncbi:MAG TPA: Nif3-like dinuclear metal center hexameric protein [Bacteroidales bacterium]|nr:Nif3-like dinuclear metal center hexameric protein [Bacteroidales bacterium]HPK29641.1 Nif3-like dinuclear metal center hexameric protein [Bacteroidales bacterium]